MSFAFRLCVALFLGISFPSTAAAAFSETEQAIVSNITKTEAEQLSLLETIVNINSGTTHITGVEQVGNLLRPHFEALGFHTSWQMAPSTLGRAGTLIAERKGSQGKRLILIGHLDTVFAKDHPFQRFVREGDYAKGPGVLDDKGGIIVILYALQALYAEQLLDGTNITVVLTGDEENAGRPISVSRRPLKEAAIDKDIALDFESAESLDTASTSRRGVAQWALTTTGKEGHSSLIFQKDTGAGALLELARILNEMREQFTSQEYLVFNPGLVVGGTSATYDPQAFSGTASGKQNVIARTATATGDLRFISEEQQRYAETTMQDIAHHSLAGTTAQFTFSSSIPAMPPTAANQHLLEQYSDVSMALGYGPVTALDPSKRGAGDISYIAGMTSANLVGLGPVGRDEHSASETLSIPSLSIQTKRAALLIYRLTR